MCCLSILYHNDQCIHVAAGGVESSLFTAEIFTMYQKYVYT